MDTGAEGQPRFQVLHVVVSLLPEEEQGEGVVIGIRRHLDGRHTFEVAPGDPSNELVGGFYADTQLDSTGRRAPVSLFWTNPGWARRIVTIADDYPNTRLRGWFGVITQELEPGEVYDVEFTAVKGWQVKVRHRQVAARYLVPTKHRLPPEPVPRPVRTHRPGHGERNVRMSHEFDIVDELDQYL